MCSSRVRVRTFPDALSWLAMAAAALGSTAAMTQRVDARGPTVVLNEIHYHPADDTRDNEFIELLNYGDDPVDLSGWELSGGARFRFPDGTVLGAESYLVLAADVERLLELDNIERERVVGPFDGSLENNGESLRLLTAGGFVASFVDYEDAAPWVETPDGLGPSLERIAPRREETDSQAWGASIPVGGTPGRPNSIRVEDVPGSDPTVDLVEEGAIWRFFRGTASPPQGWTAPDFDDSTWEQGRAGFGYDDGDDATELVDMQNRYLTVFIRRRFAVENAAQLSSLTLSIDYDDGFVATINGREVARSNVGSTRFDAPSTERHEAGAAELFSIPTPASVVQNGDNVIAIAGHNGSLDSSDFSLAPALMAMIRSDDVEPPMIFEAPPRDLVINEISSGSDGAGWVELYNSTDLEVDASGMRLRLFPSDRGDHPLPPGTLVPGRSHIVISEIQIGFELDDVAALILTTSDGRFVDALNPRTAASAHSSGRFPDGDDNRFVFPDPTPGATNAIEVDSPIVINEIMYHPADANSGGEFIELQNRSNSTIDVSGWSFTRGVSYPIPDGTTIDAGGFLVVARNPPALMERHGITGVLGPWEGRLQNDNETILLRDTLRNPRDRVRYADEGSWPEPADGEGSSVELLHPTLENRYGAAWRPSAGDGTPGAPNSQLTLDAGPLVVGIKHQPVIPRADEFVRVVATVSDVEPLAAVRLFFEVDGSAATAVELAMVDDGTHDDGLAGNGVYGAEIPPHPDRTIIAFWIRASGIDGQTVLAPRAGSNRPFLYQVEDRPRTDIRPIYRLVFRARELGVFRSRDVNSDVLLNATFVANGEAFYNRGVRHRGSSARSCNPLSYRVQFDHDVDFHGVKRLNINGCDAFRQWIGLDLLRRTEVPTPLAWFRRLSFNGQLENGWYLRVEAIDDNFLTRSFPGDSDGNLYRGVGQADIDYRGLSFDPYRPHYTKVTNEAIDDFTDVVDLCTGFDRRTTADDGFVAAIEDRIDPVQWANYFAAFAILGSSENSIVLNNGDDYFLYRRFSDDIWVLLPWDLDSVFTVADQELFRPRVESIRRFLRHPFYASTYWCELEWLLENAFERDLIDTRISHLEPLFPRAIITGLRGFAVTRRRFIERQLTQDLEITSLAGATACGDSLILDGQTRVTIAGQAPGCGTQAVTVNGAATAYDPIATTWRATVDLSDGGILRVAALDRDLAEIDVLKFFVSDAAEGRPSARASVRPEPNVELRGEPATVTLDGSNSHDGACGTDTLTYLWEKVLGPNGDSFTGSVTAANVDVELRLPGEYVYRLTVSDTARPGSSESTAVSVFVTGSTVIRNAFLRCDANGDAQHGIADPVFTLDALFRGRRPLPCRAAGDCNSDGTVNLSDAVFDLRYQFLAGDAPREPFPECDDATVETCAVATCLE